MPIAICPDEKKLNHLPLIFNPSQSLFTFTQLNTKYYILTKYQTKHMPSDLGLHWSHGIKQSPQSG
jgi:hypothetical protein